MIAAAQSVQVTDGTNGRRPSQTGGVTMGVIQQENMQQQQAQHAAHVVHNQMIAHAATQMASQQMLACSQPQMIQHHQQQVTQWLGCDRLCPILLHRCVQV